MDVKRKIDIVRVNPQDWPDVYPRRGRRKTPTSTPR